MSIARGPVSQFHSLDRLSEDSPGSSSTLISTPGASFDFFLRFPGSSSAALALLAAAAALGFFGLLALLVDAVGAGERSTLFSRGRALVEASALRKVGSWEGERL